MAQLAEGVATERKPGRPTENLETTAAGTRGVSEPWAQELAVGVTVELRQAELGGPHGSRDSRTRIL